MHENIKQQMYTIVTIKFIKSIVFELDVVAQSMTNYVVTVNFQSKCLSWFLHLHYIVTQFHSDIQLLIGWLVQFLLGIHNALNPPC